jgi:hypothetical protein
MLAPVRWWQHAVRRGCLRGSGLEGRQSGGSTSFGVDLRLTARAGAAHPAHERRSASQSPPPWVGRRAPVFLFLRPPPAAARSTRGVCWLGYPLPALCLRSALGVGEIPAGFALAGNQALLASPLFVLPSLSPVARPVGPVGRLVPQSPTLTVSTAARPFVARLLLAGLYFSCFTYNPT